MATGYKNQTFDLAMRDGTKRPIRGRVYGRMATHRMLQDGEPKGKWQVVTDVKSGTMVTWYDTAAKAGTVASWLTEYMGDRPYTDLEEHELSEIRLKIEEVRNS